jgi:crossover junction endodeoxyribonuclease RusA
MIWPPEDAVEAVTFVVAGEPKPAGSKTSGVAYRKGITGKPVPVTKNGKIVTFTKDDSGKAGKTWRADIRDAVKDVVGEVDGLLDGPLVIETRFYAERPQSHFGTGRNAGVLKATAPRYPHSSKLPDGTKLLRALEDALNKVLIADDRRFVRALWSRDFGRPRAEVTIWTLPETVGDAQVAYSEQQALALAG